MAQKFYVVWKGRQTGIFTDWSTCKKQVDHFAGARYKSFKALSEAEAAFNGDSAATTGRAEVSKPTGVNSSVKKTSTRQSPKTHTAADIAKIKVDTKIFTDGGCEPNPGEAGSGIAVYRNDVVAELWYGLYEPHGTNNTAELNALNQAMSLADDEIKQGRSVAIFCDSKYAIQCVTEWAVSWQKNGWTKKGGEIKNLELIKQMFSRYQALKDDIQILHVNGHVGVEGNELADRMSILAIASKDPEFSMYREAINIPQLLAMRAG